MNVEIGAEAALFPEKEYIKVIFVAVQGLTPPRLFTRQPRPIRPPSPSSGSLVRSTLPILVAIIFADVASGAAVAMAATEAGLWGDGGTCQMCLSPGFFA